MRQPALTNNNILKFASIAVSLKYLRNFWGSLEMPLISCKVELKLRRMKHCVLSVLANENGNVNYFTIEDRKFYVSAVTLSAKDN